MFWRMSVTVSTSSVSGTKDFSLTGRSRRWRQTEPFFQVPGADFQAHGHSLFHPFPFLGAAAQVAPVHQYAERLAVEILGAEGACQFLAVVQDGLAAFFPGRDGDDDDLLGGRRGAGIPGRRRRSAS